MPRARSESFDFDSIERARDKVEELKPAKYGVYTATINGKQVFIVADKRPVAVEHAAELAGINVTLAEPVKRTKRLSNKLIDRLKGLSPEAAAEARAALEKLAPAS